MPALTPLLLTLPLLCGAATTPASPSDPSPLSPSAADPIRRDGAHHHQPAPSYSAPATGYSNPGPSYAAPLPPVHSNSLSYGAPAKGYDAPPSTGYHPAPVKQTGYYYYYYPVDVKKKEKEGKGFYGKMKKMFEPIWYPYNYMMDYFGYGEESYDYDYDSYGHYRSVTETASEYIPWDSIEEVGTVLTQDECMEFYMCQLGSYGRDYGSVHFLVDMVVPFVRNNSYYRSLATSMLKDIDCFDYHCPVVRREPIENQI